MCAKMINPQLSSIYARSLQQLSSPPRHLPLPSVITVPSRVNASYQQGRNQPTTLNEEETMMQNFGDEEGLEGLTFVGLET